MNPPVGGKSRLCIPNQLGYVPPLLAYASELAGRLGFDEGETGDIALALQEAVANIIKYGYDPGDEGEIEVDFEATAEGLVLTIRDRGLPFDPEALPEYDPSSGQEDELALGIHRVRQAVDEIVLRNLGRGGNEAQLTKRRSKGRVTALSQEGTPPARGQTMPPLDIRRLQPHEAVEVSRCAYRAYGHTYEEFIYFPEQIQAMNRAGRLTSLVAMTPEGELAGHVALKRLNGLDPVGELGVALVAPKFRGGGVLGALTSAILLEAEKAGLYGVYLRAVTSHEASQRGAYSAGFRACGIALARYPEDVEFKHLSGRVRQRESSVTAFRQVAPEGSTTRRLYVPNRHREVIAEVYAGIGLGAEFGDPCPSRSTDPTVLHEVTTSGLNVADITVYHQGPDLVRTVRARLRHLCREQVDVVTLALDAQDPGTGCSVGNFEEMGFFFSGVLPWGLRGHDALILQYLNNLALDYEQIRPWSDEARLLLQRVRQNDPSQSMV